MKKNKFHFYVKAAMFVSLQVDAVETFYTGLIEACHEGYITYEEKMQIADMVKERLEELKPYLILMK